MYVLRVGLMVGVISLGAGGWTPVWVQDLRQALIDSFEAEIQALNTRDLAAAVDPADENIVVYGLYSPFPIEGKSAFQEAVKEYFDSHESAVLRLVYPQYLVAGSTGVAWGHYELTAIPTGGTQNISHGQYMLTYAHPAEKWRIISIHFAPLPGSTVKASD